MLMCLCALQESIKGKRCSWIEVGCEQLVGELTVHCQSTSAQTASNGPATVPLLCNQLRLLCSYRSDKRYTRYYRRYFAAQQQPCPFCAISCVYFAATEATDAKDAATDATLQRNTNRVVSVQKSCCYSADLICLHCCIHLLGGVHLKTSPVNCLSSAGLMPVPACLSMSTRSACLSMSTRSACLSMSTACPLSACPACLSMSTHQAGKPAHTKPTSSLAKGGHLVLTLFSLVTI